MSRANDECRMPNDELPDGWLRVPFSAVTVNPVQRVPSEKEQITYIDIGSVDRITKQVVEPQTMLGKDAPSRARKVIQTGDVLVSTVRPNLNAVALVESQYNGQFASTGFDVLRSPVVDPRWLFYSVRTPEFLDRMSELVQGALYPAVRSFDIRSFVIPIAPLAEQKRIADKLEAVLGRVDACRARLDRVPALLKRFRQSVLASAVSGDLTEEWRAQNQRELEDSPNEVSADELAELPHGWRWTCSSKFKSPERYALSIGPFGSNLKVSDYRDEGVPLVFVREIRARDFGGGKTKFVTPEKAQELKAHSISGGDLLITKMGDPPGDAAIYPVDSPTAIITADCIKLRVDSTKASTAFVGYVIESPQVRDRLQDIVAGVAQQKISLERFRDFPLPMAPLPEQQEIVRRVEDLFAFADRIEARLATAQKTVERLTPATLAKAFRGELVPQDPKDEPASVLLERLKSAEPVARPGRKTRAKR